MTATRLEREQLVQPDERHAKTVSRTTRWATPSAVRSANRAATTSCSSFTATSIGQRRAAAPSLPSADRPGTGRRLLAVDGQPGPPIPQLYDATLGRKTGCTGTVAAPLISTTCFPGNKIPANRSTHGLAILNQWKLAAGIEPNATGLDYNYETVSPLTENLTQQPAVRGDYQFSPGLRVTGKYAGQRQRPCRYARLNSRVQRHVSEIPVHPQLLDHGELHDQSDDLLRRHVGHDRELPGCAADPTFSNRANLGLANFPLIFPDAGIMDSRTTSGMSWWARARRSSIRPRT